MRGSSGNVNSMVQATTSLECNGSTQNKASGSVSQLRWTRGESETSYQQASAIMWNLATRRSEARIGFRGGGEEIQGSPDRRTSGRGEFAHFNGQAWSQQGNRAQFDSTDARTVRPRCDVILLRKAGEEFVMDLWVRKDAISEEPSSPASLESRIVPNR